MTTLRADAQGIVRGRFTVPTGLPAGTKQVIALGEGGSYGNASFSGQGTLERQNWQNQTTISETRWQSPPPPPPPVLEPVWIEPWIEEPPRPARVDPLAQTFVLDMSAQIVAIDLWLMARGATDITVQLRETTTGFPNQMVIAQSRRPTAGMATGGPVRFAFESPVFLAAGREFALVALCDDADSMLGIAELGKWDNTAGQWVTSQPYTVGVLLSSSNAVTWTPHQDRDMTFRLLAARYTQLERVIPLGQVSVSNATDLMLMAFAERPDSAARVAYRLTLPNGSVLTTTDGQPLRLAEPTSGAIAVAAHLQGSERCSPVLHPGTQLVVGEVAPSADYVSRAFPAGSGVRVRVIFDAQLPGNAAVTVQLQGADDGVAGAWAAADRSATRALDDGWVECTHALEPMTAQAVRVKLILTGSHRFRPMVRNLRVIVM